MSANISRILYLLAAISWVILLWPNPITIFLAACLAILTQPWYRRLRLKGAHWRRKLIKLQKPGRWQRMQISFSDWMPTLAYTISLIAAIFIPLAAVILLVSPQAMAGLARLRELRAQNFQLPPSWVEYFQSLWRHVQEYPRIEKLITDAYSNIDYLISDAAGMLVSRSFGFVGGTMTLFWLFFLFLTMTVLFVVYGGLIRKICCRIFNIPTTLLGRYIVSIHRALRAIMLGIVLVALIQGALCGIGFAVAGVNQPAFWGMLAVFVAPIPTVGTALVWFPLCLSLWFTGSTFAAIALAIWGSLFVSGVDNILRPFFLRQGIDASFFVLILAILCGLSVFGVIGLIAGPVALAIGMQSYKEANHYYKHNLK